MLTTTAGQYIGGKVVTAILAAALLGGGYWCYKNPDDLKALWHVIKYVVVWIGVVGVLPWATFFVTTWVVARDSNRAAAAMLAGYLVADVVVAICLMGRVSGLGTLTWMVLLLGFLSAAVYNFKVSEYLADRAEDF